uniref:Uncharacterized protein n=1 Tax=Rhizophora mucronata TaxID=61149 RepID=A0A2P2N9S0_RHIMU
MAGTASCSLQFLLCVVQPGINKLKHCEGLSYSHPLGTVNKFSNN